MSENETLHPTQAMEQALKYIEDFQRAHPEDGSQDQAEEQAMLWMLEYLVEDMAVRFPDELRKLSFIDKGWLAQQEQVAP